MVMNTDRTAVSGAQTVAIGAYSQAFADGYQLVTRKPLPTAAAITGLNASKYYCSGSDIERYSPVIETDASGRKKSRYNVNFCFSDEDSDGRVDHAFVISNKMPELLKAVAINPFPVRELGLSPRLDPTDARLIYKRLTPGDRNILFYIRLFKGKTEYISSYFKVWQGDDASETKQDAKVNIKYGDSLPFALPQMIGYRITLDSVDPKTGEIAYHYERAAEATYYQSVFNGGNTGMIFIFYH